MFPKEEIKQIMTLYGSTSPSYLIMASLEQAASWMLNEGKAAFAALQARMEQLGSDLRRRGIILLDRVTDCTKLTLDAGRMGYAADELAEILRAGKIAPEFVGGGTVVLMFSPPTPEEDVARL